MNQIRRTLTAVSAVSLLALAACDGPEVIEAKPQDPQAAELAKAAPVALPPSIAASHTYRCKDNSLVYVDFMSDQKTVNFRTKKGGDPIVLSAPEAGQPFVAEGYSVTGGGTQISLTAPGMGTQSCKA